MKNQARKVEPYLFGDLPDDALEEFEKSLKVDPNLKNEISLRESINHAITDKTAFKLKSTLEEIIQQNSNKQKSPPIISIFSRKRVYRIAAGVAAFFILGGSIILFDHNPTPQQLYVDYFNPTEVGVNVRSVSRIQDENIVLGYQAYEQGEYSKAIISFENSPDHIMGQMLTGLSYMQLKDYNSAQKSFESIIKNNDNLFIDQAEWNLALTYLQLNQVTEAKRHLGILVKEKGPYSGKAQKILKNLN